VRTRFWSGAAAILFTATAFAQQPATDQVEVSSSADLGYSIGDYERIGKDPSGNPSSATGSYVSIWRKQPDGRWKIVLDIGTPGSPRKP